MVQFGLDLAPLRTALDLDEAIELLEARAGEGGEADGR
jgi:hypothetical protein